MNPAWLTLPHFVCACDAPTVRLGVLPSGEPMAECTRCFASRPMTRVHLVWKLRMTACALAFSGDTRNTLDVAQVTCPDCVDMLVTELATVPEVDWRPAAAIPEDHYAR
jgi:hypothetical protein